MKGPAAARAAPWLVLLLVSACGARTSLDVPDWGLPVAVGGSNGSDGGSGGSAPLVTGGTDGDGGRGSGGSPALLCEPGSFETDGDPATPCEPCPLEVSVDDPAECRPPSHCSWEEREVMAGSPTAERVCVDVGPTRQFGTDQSDGASDVAVDADGYIYVSGYTYGSLDGLSAGNADAFIRRYRPSGELDWSRQIGSEHSEFGGRLALSPSGDLLVLVNGLNLSTYVAFTLLHTLDTNGNFLWEVVAEGGASDLVAAEFGELFLTRHVTASAGDLDIQVEKLTPTGTPIWSRLFATSEDDFPSSLVTLPGGDVVVCGATRGALFDANSGFEDAVVARLSGAGDLLWSLQFGGPGPDTPRAAGANAAQAIYVAGSTSAMNGYDADGLLLQISPSGSLDWAVAHGTTTIDDFNGLTVDFADRVSVTGDTWGTFGEAQHGTTDGFVAAILEGGDLGAVNQFGTGSQDFAQAVAAAPDGALYVVGGTYGAFGGPSAGDSDAYVLRIPPPP